LLHIKPGHGDQFWADLRQDGKPVYDEEKRQGILTNYTVSTKSTVDHPEDCSVVLTLTFPNWAALDAFTSRTDPITFAHSGSAANRTAAALARVEHSTVVGSILVRDQAVLPGSSRLWNEQSAPIWMGFFFLMRIDGRPCTRHLQTPTRRSWVAVRSH